MAIMLKVPSSRRYTQFKSLHFVPTEFAIWNQGTLYHVAQTRYRVRSFTFLDALWCPPSSKLVPG